MLQPLPDVTFSSIFLSVDIIKLGLLDLPDDKDLKTPCTSYKHEMYKGDSVVGIISLDFIEDNSYHWIEYKIGNKSKTLVYRNPNDAFEICPNSEERMRFLKIMKLIEGL